MNIDPIRLDLNGVDQAALEHGLALAQEIAAAAIWDGDMCAFQGATPSPVLGQPAHWRVFGGDYYEGSAGIARALGYAAALGAGEDVARAAHGAIAHALAQADGWSLHSGRLGAGLVAIELATLLQTPDLAQTGYELCIVAAEQALTDPGPVALDFLAGLAGVLHAASALVRVRPGDWRYRAYALAYRLAEAGVAQPLGRSWALHEADPQHLCGLAHGASGVALAFEDFAEISDDPAPWQAEAAAARLFERSHFDPAACSWADLRVDARQPDASPTYPHMWCHGSIGIGHERLQAYRRHRDSPLIAADLAAALTAARREAARIAGGPAGPGAGFGANACQCHGLSGLIDLLVETGDPQDLALARHVAAFVRLDALRPEGHRCGNPSGEPAPGLMLGLAGIVWGQLRAAGPNVSPCAWTPVGGSLIVDAISGLQ